MSWGEHVFAYCERGLDASFWAEPLNAVSNVAFLLASALAYVQWRGSDRGGDGARSRVEPALIALVSVIGIGSFTFHTLATRWAVLADVVPITLFMLAYLTFALRRLVRAGWAMTAGLLTLFCAALWTGDTMRCGDGPCLNGSAGYLPALAALALIGAWLAWHGQAAAGLLLAAAGVFLISLTLRTFDRALCSVTTIEGRPLGLHFLWHIANATLLYLLLRAAILHGAQPVPASGAAVEA